MYTRPEDEIVAIKVNAEVMSNSKDTASFKEMIAQ